MDLYYSLLIYTIFGAYTFLFLVAAVFDVTTFLIPNWITISVGGLFFATAFALPFDTAWSAHLGAAAAVFIGGLLLYRFGVLGAGDVKLVTAAALWTGLDRLPMFLLYIGLAGGGMAIGLTILRRAFATAVIYVPSIEPITRPRFMRNGEGLPYGVAIAAGSLAIAHGLRPFEFIL